MTLEPATPSFHIDSQIRLLVYSQLKKKKKGRKDFLISRQLYDTLLEFVVLSYLYSTSSLRYQSLSNIVAPLGTVR